MAEATAGRDPDVMRKTNDLIWQSLDNGGRTEPTAFFCECAEEGCYRPVWLSPAEYGELRQDPLWRAVADGHEARPVVQRMWVSTRRPKAPDAAAGEAPLAGYARRAAAIHVLQRDAAPTRLRDASR